MTKEELEKEAREYLAEHSEYSEVFGQTFVAVDTLTAMVDFAEPREKRIAELEYQLTHRNCLDCSNHSSKLRMRNLDLEKENAELKKTYRKQRNKRIDELQKENAELKKLKRECETSLCRAEYQYNYEQLTKAKEIIKNLMAFAEMDDREYEKEYKQAEQFISEVEK